MKSRAVAAAFIAAVCALALAACGSDLPPDVDQTALTDAISGAVGDPSTCLLVAEAASGRVIYRYNTHMVCARQLAACDAPDSRRVGDLLKAVAADGRSRASTCDNPKDAARTIAWSAGPVTGRKLVYAAVMDGERTFPSRIMTERIDAALRNAGLAR
ncbi:hypothetical protein [Phenylobacterium sp.]|uniref:hypothetical protein n=1 Tax=Phenylobacterium sp. TaxID=1871053 RepID=UPI00273599F9|nr:hypothetical protein [Phenylobacterium sp.]MDP3659640.1 hypothetical protein [Phenylobacterium sp.]